MVRILPLLLIGLLCTACKKSQRSALAPATPAQQHLATHNQAAQPRVPPCTFITKEEVGEIQRATITDAKGSAGLSGTMLMSQCYYSAKEPNMSVSLAVIEHNPQDASAPDARTYWNESLRRLTGETHDQENSAEEKDSRRSETSEEKENRLAPKKVDGVGEEAYWSGTRFGGALYILAKDAIIRVSVGGPGDEQAKLQKSKQLAQKALSRLP
jgi:hypothetical protein